MHTCYAINLMLNIWHDAMRDTNCQFRLTLGAVYMYWCFEGGFWCSDVYSTVLCDKWPMHFDWVIIVRSVRLSSPQCSHAKHLIGHYYLAGNWAADEWASDGHLWMETAEASTFPLLNKANSVHLITVIILLILMRIILYFQTCILDTTNIFVDGKKDPFT